MADPIKRALTRKHIEHGKLITQEPNNKLVIGIKFALTTTAILSTLEITHMIFLHTWNSEIFAAITGLSGTVLGLFVGQKT